MKHVILMWSIFWAGDLLACSCEPTALERLEKNPQSARISFLGKVKKADLNKISFQVVKTFRGVEGKELVMPHSGGICGFEGLKTGENYLVVTDDFTHYPISICSALLVPEKDAGIYLKKLKAKPTAADSKK